MTKVICEIEKIEKIFMQDITKEVCDDADMQEITKEVCDDADISAMEVGEASTKGENQKMQ